MNNPLENPPMTKQEASNDADFTETKEVTPTEKKEEMNTTDKKHPRGGRGTKASPELTTALSTLEQNKIKDRQLAEELKRDEKMLDKEVERLDNVYSQFTEDLKVLEGRLAEETNTKERKRLNALMSQAQDHLRALRNILPKEAPGPATEHDVEVFKDIVEKFKRYEKARREQTMAAIKLNEGHGSTGKVERARTEAHQLHEEIVALTKKGEIVINRDVPNPVTDDSVNIHTGEEDEKIARKHKEEHLFATEARAEDQNLSEKNMSQETPLIPTPPEQQPKTPEEKKTEGALKFKETLKEQLAELEGRTDPASNAERAEIERTLSDIDSALGKTAENLQQNDTAKEVEETVSTGTVDNWQEEAVKNFESMGHKVLEAELLPEEKKNIPLPLMTEVVELPPQKEVALEPSEPEAPAPAATPEKGVSYPVLDKGGIEAVAEKNKLTRERALGLISKIENDVNAHAEKVGVTEKILRVAEKWNALKSEHRIAYTTLMLLAGAGSVGTGTLAAGGALAITTKALHLVSGAGIFYSKEKQYEAEAKNANIERTPEQIAKDRIKAIAWGVVGGGLLSYILAWEAKEIGEGIAEITGGAQEASVATAASTSMPTEHAEIANPLAAEPSPAGEAVHEVAAEETPARLASIEEFTEKPFPRDLDLPPQVHFDEAPTMPSEIMPEDPQVLAYANEMTHNHLDEMFGSKGLFGIFGGEEGANSINWKDPDVGFANKTVEEVLNAKPSAFPNDGARHFGIEDYSATQKMQEYLRIAKEQTGLVPQKGETVDDFIHRGAAANIAKFMKNG